MKINEYVTLLKRDNDVCYDIDNYLYESITKKYDNLEMLLKDAADVITEYRSFIYLIMNEVDIEDCFKKQ